MQQKFKTLNMNNVTIYRVKVTPLHSSPNLVRLIVNVDDERLSYIKKWVGSEPGVKVKVLNTIFPPHSGKQKSVSNKKLDDWYAKLTLANPGSGTPLISQLKKGDLFTFIGGKSLMVYDGKLTKGEYHYHRYEDVNHISSTKNGLRPINII